MPKPKTETWDDNQIDEFLKSRGHDTQAPAAPGAGTAQADTAPGFNQGPGVLEQIRSFLAGDAPIGRQPSYGEMDWQQAMGQGVARRGASLLTGAARLAGKGMKAAGSLLPEHTSKGINEAVDRDFENPTFQRLEEFGNEQSEGFAESAGSFLPDIAMGGMMPSLRLGQLAARAVPATRAVPTMTQVAGSPVWVNPLGAGGRFMQTAPRFVAGTTRAANPRALAAARMAGGGAEAAAKGAAAGAISNPDDPLTGAEAGAGAGVGGKVAGAALRSPMARSLGGHLARYVPASALGYLIGGHYGHGPLGALLGGAHHAASGTVRHARHGGLERFGQAVFDSAGRFLGYLPGTAGAVAGRATSDRPMIDVRKRSPPLPPEEPNARQGD